MQNAPCTPSKAQNPCINAYIGPIVAARFPRSVSLKQSAGRGKKRLPSLRIRHTGTFPEKKQHILALRSLTQSAESSSFGASKQQEIPHHKIHTLQARCRGVARRSFNLHGMVRPDITEGWGRDPQHLGKLYHNDPLKYLPQDSELKPQPDKLM